MRIIKFLFDFTKNIWNEINILILLLLVYIIWKTRVLPLIGLKILGLSETYIPIIFVGYTFAIIMQVHYCRKGIASSFKHFILNSLIGIILFKIFSSLFSTMFLAIFILFPSPTSSVFDTIMYMNPNTNVNIGNIPAPQPGTQPGAPQPVTQPGASQPRTPSVILPPAPNPNALPFQDPNGTTTNPFVPGHQDNRNLGQQAIARILQNDHYGWPSLRQNDMRWLHGALADINPAHFGPNPTYRCSPNNIYVRTNKNIKGLANL